MRAALTDGRLTFGIVYTYVRPNWLANTDTVCAMIGAGYGSNRRLPGQIAHQ
ncbi:hypothetical protein ABQE69_03475 [Mycolicibacillus trivialis]